LSALAPFVRLLGPCALFWRLRSGCRRSDFRGRSHLGLCGTLWRWWRSDFRFSDRHSAGGPGFSDFAGCSDFPRCSGGRAMVRVARLAVAQQFAPSARAGRQSRTLRGLAVIGSSARFRRRSSGCCRGRRCVGGATFVSATTLTAGAAAAGFNSLRAASSSGLPGFAARYGCCAAKPIGGRRRCCARDDRPLEDAAGGLSRCAALPRTLFSVGASCGKTVTGALTITSCDTRTVAWDTGCDCTKAVVGTATTAPGIR